MEFSYQIFIFFLGFLSAVIAIALFYFFFNNKKKFENNQHEDLGSIKENIRSIQQELQNFNLVQDRIENSIIKGGSKEQGDWGELVLKNILDSSGLQEPQDYETQKVYQDSEGNPQKPDVIVHMPGKRDIIIDSKVTLKSWHEYSNAKDENSKSIHFKKFLEAVKDSIKKLDKASYQNLYEIKTLDAILMFIPVEPAFIALYKDGDNLVQEAWKKKIMIVCPSTLPFLLKTVENLWRIEKQSKRVEEIAKKAGDIYDKAYGVYDSFSHADKALQTAKDKMKDAKDKLKDGTNSFTKQVQKIKDLGRLSTKKTLPSDVIEDKEKE
jgi:DNA recombination protein RmuC